MAEHNYPSGNVRVHNVGLNCSARGCGCVISEADGKEVSFDTAEPKQYCSRCAELIEIRAANNEWDYSPLQQRSYHKVHTWRQERRQKFDNGEMTLEKYLGRKDTFAPVFNTETWCFPFEAVMTAPLPILKGLKGDEYNDAKALKTFLEENHEWIRALRAVWNGRPMKRLSDGQLRAMLKKCEGFTFLRALNLYGGRMGVTTELSGDEKKQQSTYPMPPAMLLCIKLYIEKLERPPQTRRPPKGGHKSPIWLALVEGGDPSHTK